MGRLWMTARAALVALVGLDAGAGGRPGERSGGARSGWSPAARVPPASYAEAAKPSAVKWFCAKLGGLLFGARSPLPPAYLSAHPLPPAHYTKAAETFDVNLDYLAPGLRGGGPGTGTAVDTIDLFPARWEQIREAIRVAADDGKVSAIAVEDKLLMHDVVERLRCDVKQMPNLMWRQTRRNGFAEGGSAANDLPERLGNRTLFPRGPNFVVKPTHLSSGEGVEAKTSDPLSPLRKSWSWGEIRNLMKHSHETGANTMGEVSKAARAVLPGAVLQPLYPSPSEAQPFTILGMSQVTPRTQRRRQSAGPIAWRDWFAAEGCRPRPAGPQKSTLSVWVCFGRGAGATVEFEVGSSAGSALCVCAAGDPSDDLNDDLQHHSVPAAIFSGASGASGAAWRDPCAEPLSLKCHGEVEAVRRDEADFLRLERNPLELRVQVAWGGAFSVQFFDAHFSANNLWFTPFGDASYRAWEARFLPRPPWATPGATSKFYLDTSKIYLDASSRGALAEYLRTFLDEVVPQAECLARGLKVPWARFDFFVPPPGEVGRGWPVVLNEVEYNSGAWWFDVAGAESAARGADVDFRDVVRTAGRLGAEKIWAILSGGLKGRDGDSPATEGVDFFRKLGCNFTQQGQARELYEGLRCAGDGHSTEWFGAPP